MMKEGQDTIQPVSCDRSNRFHDHCERKQGTPLQRSPLEGPGDAIGAHMLHRMQSTWHCHQQ